MAGSLALPFPHTPANYSIIHFSATCTSFFSYISFKTLCIVTSTEKKAKEKKRHAYSSTVQGVEILQKKKTPPLAIFVFSTNVGIYRNF